MATIKHTNQPPIYPSVVERNFVSYISSENPGIRYLRHPSGVIVVTLDCSSHEITQKEIESIRWESQKKGHHGIDRNKLVISGKSKRGGLEMFPETRLCTIYCRDGTEHVIRAGIRANLIEVNSERLDKNPNLTRTAADSYGFLAIMIPTGAEGRNLLHIPKNLKVDDRN